MIDLGAKLSDGLQLLAIEASASQKDQLLSLLEQLLKWNKTYNLTAITDPEEVLTLHLFDSLAVKPLIKQKNIIDVGTGAGFPGLPLAIMLPDVQFTLLDSNSKKIRFIHQQIHLLGLTNVIAVHSRVENYQQQFDGIISRAFASLEDMITITAHLLDRNGCWLAMKGQYSKQEVINLSNIVDQVACYPLNVPGLSAERCLVELKAK